MADLATREEFDGLKKSVSDLVELVKKNDKEQEDKILKLVKDAAAAHPGANRERKIEFTSQDFSKGMREQAILKKLPVEIQDQSDELFLLSRMLEVRPDQLKSWSRFTENLGDFKKALDAGTSGGVSEWVPTRFTDRFFEFVRLQTKVRSLFPVIPMPASPYLIPIGIGRMNSFKVAEQTADTGQDKVPVGDTSSLSSSTTLTAKSHGTRVLTSHNVEEDSIVPVLPFLRQEIIRALAEGAEDAMLNGDTAGSHEDTDISSATDRRKLWLGLRRLSNANSYKTDLSTFNLTNIRVMRKNMGIWGTNPSNLAIICGISGYMKMLSLAEVVTVDKYGSNATILNGELAKVDGIPIIVSEWIRTVLDANAIYSASGAKTVFHMVNPSGFVVGERRQVDVRLLTEIYAESEQDALMAVERLTFDPIYPIATNHMVETAYNFAS